MVDISASILANLKNKSKATGWCLFSNDYSSSFRTPYEHGSFDHIIALADDVDMQVKWRYFLKTIKGRKIAFMDVVTALGCFLRPVWNAIIDED